VRYKTLFATTCVNNHSSLTDDRIHADSKEKAQLVSVENIKNVPCHFCKAPLKSARLIGTDVLPEYPQYNAIGYTCGCGEKVIVFREEEGDAIAFPLEGTTVTCSKGHSRTIANLEFLLLERWKEQTN
jgi:hypothetical protein